MRRAATEDDLEAVHAIYMHASVIPYLAHDPMLLDTFRPIYAGLIAGGLQVWEVDGRIAGFYRAPRHEGRAHHVAMLSTLAMHPDFQGKGVAREMVEDAIERLAREGVTRIELMAEADNPRGLAFYRKLGFETEGSLRKAYRRAGEAEAVDEAFMARLLD